MTTIDPTFRLTAGVAERWNENHAHLVQGCAQICQEAIRDYSCDALIELKHLFENYEPLYNVQAMAEYRPVPQIRSYV